LREVGEDAFVGVSIRPTLPTKKCLFSWINWQSLTFLCLSSRFQLFCFIKKDWRDREVFHYSDGNRYWIDERIKMTDCGIQLSLIQWIPTSIPKWIERTRFERFEISKWKWCVKSGWEIQERGM
jgi:hypothetical protein